MAEPLGEVVIARRFRGPPDSGQGGYSAAMVGLRVPGAAEVLLRVPPPLERPLTLERDGETVRMLDGEVVVAEARPTVIETDIPEPPTFEEARAASARAPVAIDPSLHFFPECYGCGPLRDPDDALRLLAGPLEGRPDEYAAPWVPGPGFADDAGHVRPEHVWGALDCPSAAPVFMMGGEITPHLLGRFAVRLDEPVHAGEPHVVLAWERAREGRKLLSATAIFDASDRVLAVAEATWIRVRPSHEHAAPPGSS